MSTNPYAAPKAAVSDVEDTQEVQEIRMWSADGRIGRLRYLAYGFGSSMIVGAISGGMAAVMDPSTAATLTLVLYIPLLWFAVITGIKRSHDMNWTGWTVLLTIIPFVALIWIFKAGSEGNNDYGAPPPPNTTGVKILALTLPIIAIVGIVAAILIPALATR